MTLLKSPALVAEKLAKQWQNHQLREARWFADDGAYPIVLPIPAPSAAMVAQSHLAVKAHLKAWKAVTVGEVIYADKRYRALAEPLSVPRRWVLGNVDDWIRACQNKTVRDEYRHYQAITQKVSKPFHRLLIRHKGLVTERDSEEVIRACQLAEQLSPDIAGGAPLRALAFAGTDSKFFERHRKFIIKLLDVRFSGEASRVGLETFLGASKDEHWISVVDLDGDLLPFAQQKIRVTELQQRGLPDAQLLIVENVQVTQMLPHLPKTLAVLGAGLDLAWLSAAWTAERRIVYWGDMDTWGLAMLARARHYRSDIEAVLMDANHFHAHQEKAVPERTLADSYIADVWMHLTPCEQVFYQQLKNTARGRLEQEFLPIDIVHDALIARLCQR